MKTIEDNLVEMLYQRDQECGPILQADFCKRFPQLVGKRLQPADLALIAKSLPLQERYQSGLIVKMILSYQEEMEWRSLLLDEEGWHYIRQRPLGIIDDLTADYHYVHQHKKMRVFFGQLWKLEKFSRAPFATNCFNLLPTGQIDQKETVWVGGNYVTGFCQDRHGQSYLEVPLGIKVPCNAPSLDSLIKRVRIALLTQGAFLRDHGHPQVDLAQSIQSFMKLRHNEITAAAIGKLTVADIPREKGSMRRLSRVHLIQNYERHGGDVGTFVNIF